MESKKVLQAILERAATNAQWKEKVLTCDLDSFIAALKENGVAEVAREEAQALLEAVRAALGAELEDDALEAIAGGRPRVVQPREEC